MNVDLARDLIGASFVVLFLSPVCYMLIRSHFQKDIARKRAAEVERLCLQSKVEQERQRSKALAGSWERDREILSVIMEHTAVSLFYLDLQFNYVMVNAAHARTVGYRRDELIGRNLFELFPTAEGQHVFERVRDTGEPVSVRARPYRFTLQPWRGIIYWDCTLIPAKSISGQVEGLVVTATEVTEQAYNAEALGTWEDRYRRIVETASEGIWIIDRENKTTFVNNKAAEMLGYSVDEMIGQSLFAFMDQKEQAFAQANVERRRHGIAENHDFRFRRKDGSALWTIVSTTPIFDKEGCYAGALGMLTDITARKQVEEALQAAHAELEKRVAERTAELVMLNQALRESEQKFRSIVEQSHDGIVLVDEEGKIVEWNRAQERISGLVKDQVTGLPAWEVRLRLIPEELRTAERLERTKGMMQEALRLGQGAWLKNVQEGIIRRSDGTRRIIQDLAGLIQTDKGFMICSISRDVTEKKQDEAALRESEEYFRRFFDQSPIGAAVVSVDFHYLRVNEAFCHFTGYSEQELLSLSFPQITHPDDLPSGLHLTSQLFGGEIDTFQMEKRYIRKDGEVVWGHLSVRVIRDDQGQVIFSLPMVVDITARKRAEQERDRQLARERALTLIGRSLVNEFDLAKIAEIVIEQSGIALGVDGVALYLADPARRELTRLIVGDERTKSNRIEESYRISYDSDLAAAQAARFEAVQIIENLQSPNVKSPLARDWARKSGMHSLLAVPLLSRGHLVGVLTLLSHLPRQFSPRDLEFNVMVADMFAVAIEKARLHQDLQEREGQVSLLLKKTIDAQEEERQRICLEIHDSTAQTLVSAYRYLQAMDGHPQFPDGLRQHLHKASGLVQDASREVREIISSLRPGTLDLLGLVPTLRHELANFELEHNLHVDFAADELHLPETIETSLYRILHEAINNVVKHAAAKLLTIKMTRKDMRVVITIQDDGIGFDVSEFDHQLHPKGFGLLSMRKRAELIQASFSLQSKPGAGTLVRLDLPSFVSEFDS